MSRVALKALAGSGAKDYEIDQSLMFAPNAHLSRNVGSASNRKTWTWSAWVKRGTMGTSAFQSLFMAYDNSSASDSTWLSIDFRGSSPGDGDVDKLGIGLWGSSLRITNRLFRDPSAWYHLVVALDTTIADGSADNRVRVYINGVEETSFSSENNPSQNADLGVNAAQYHMVGAWNYSGSGSYFNGYQAEVNFVDGSQLTPSSFGKTNSATGQWVPKEYTGSYGTNGFYLKFVSGAIGTDSSGEGNNYTTANIDNDDIFLDSPTNNFATANPLSAGTGIDWYQGNTVPYQPTVSVFGVTVSTIAVESGKYYAEFRLRGTDSNAQYIGAGTYVPIVDNSNQNGNGSGNVVLFPLNSTAEYRAIVVDGTPITTDLAAGSQGDKYGVAMDIDNKKVYFYRNGSAIGSTSGYSITDVGTGKYHFIIGVRGSSGYTGYWEANFGANSSFAGNETKQYNGGEGEDFYYTPPTGYKALSTANLPIPTIKKPTDHFNTVLWAGADTSAAKSVTGVGFQPDFVWSKSRSDAYHWNVYDIVRGVGKRLNSDSTNVESSNNAYGYLSAFDSDGFTTAAGSTNNENWNKTSSNYVAYNWKAGGSGSTNEDGATDSTVSVNTTAGFSIVGFTMPGSGSTTYGHGLGAVPDFIMAKPRAGTGNWSVWVKPPMDSTDDYMQLNSTVAQGSYSTVWGAAVPTSSVFGATCGGLVPADATGIAYCFAEVDGYSKFGSYEANNSTTGTFIYTNFTPAWLMIKYVDGAGESWWIYDNKRNVAFNLNDDVMYANLTAAEGSSGGVDFVSNGFKLRATSGGLNSANTYSYMAFASSPFKYSNAR